VGQESFSQNPFLLSSSKLVINHSFVVTFNENLLLAEQKMIENRDKIVSYRYASQMHIFYSKKQVGSYVK